MCRHPLGKMKEKELNKYAKNMQDKHVNLRVVMKKKSDMVNKVKCANDKGNGAPNYVTIDVSNECKYVFNIFLKQYN
jgi:hypothetical protein